MIISDAFWTIYLSGGLFLDSGEADQTTWLIQYRQQNFSDDQGLPGAGLEGSKHKGSETRAARMTEGCKNFQKELLNNYNVEQNSPIFDNFYAYFAIFPKIWEIY